MTTEGYDYNQYTNDSTVQRREIQEKVFLKWLNYRMQTCLPVENLFEELRSGKKLLALVENLSGEKLHIEKNENKDLMTVQSVLNYLRDADVFLGTITAAEIMKGEAKPTLELLWRIILHFEIEFNEDDNDRDADSGRKILMNWARVTTAGYYGVLVADFGASWRDGRAFNAILHRNRPDLFDWKSISVQTSTERLLAAFRLAEQECGVLQLLNPEDVDIHEPDEKSIMTYVALLRRKFPYPPGKHPLADNSISKKENFFFLSNGSD